MPSHYDTDEETNSDWRVRSIICSGEADTGAAFIDAIDPELLEECMAKSLSG